MNTCLRLTAEGQRLVQEHQGLAYLAARKLAARCPRLDFDELLSMCLVSLCEAVADYDPARAKLSTWVFRKCQQHLLHRRRAELRDEHRRRRLAQRLHTEYRQRSQAADPFTQIAEQDETQYLWRLVQRVATPPQRCLVAELASGTRLNEVAARWGRPRQSVSYLLAALRQRAQRALRQSSAGFPEKALLRTPAFRAS
jgi:RNA polymerase sigma factor (sigma-70 family)